jgi:hypothetical protein
MKLNSEDRKYIRQAFLTIGGGAVVGITIYYIFSTDSVKSDSFYRALTVWLIGWVMVLIPLIITIKKNTDQKNELAENFDEANSENTEGDSLIGAEQKEIDRENLLAKQKDDAEKDILRKQKKTRKLIVALNNLLFLAMVLLFYFLIVRPQNKTIIENKNNYESRINLFIEEINHYKFLLTECEENTDDNDDENSGENGSSPIVNKQMIQGRIKIGSTRNDTIIKSNITFFESQIGKHIETAKVPKESVIKKSIFLYPKKGARQKVEANSTIEMLTGVIEYEPLPNGITILWLTVKTEEP